MTSVANLLLKLFHPLFSVLFLLSIFLIEGSLKFYIFTLWALFFVIFSLYQKKLTAEEAVLSRSIVLSLILALAAVISVLFSSHLPLSLEKLSFYLIAFASFIFFRNLKQKVLQPSLIFYYLSLSSLVLNLFVLFFTFMDPGAELFTGMNLLIRSYGHNHYAAFLLLLTPVFWWQLLFAKDETWMSRKEITVISVILLLSSYLLIIFSLGRVAMAISLLQLLLIFFFNKKELFKSVHSQLYQALIKAFMFAFAVIIGLFFILSLPIKPSGKQLCPLMLSRKELCKPWVKNDRQRYWQKAWLVFSDKPLVGSGLKTFNFASRQFPMANYATTSYAHNIFLHNLAEGGFVFGGFFIFYISYLFYAAFKQVRRGGQPLDRFLLLAAASSLLNAMLDYDWNFFVIFNLTLIFLALILRQAEEPTLKLPNNLSKILRVAGTLFFILLLFAGTLLSGAFFTADLLRRQGKIDLLVRYFPFMDRPIRRALADKKLSAKHFAELNNLYSFDTHLTSELVMLKDVPSNQTTAAWLTLAELDPLFFVNQLDLSKFTFAQAKPLADKFIETSQKNDFIDDNNLLDYWHQRNLAASLVNLGNQAYQEGQIDLAASFYKDALLLNEFALSIVTPVFLKETNLDSSAKFLLQFTAFDPIGLDRKFYDYLGLYQNTLLHLFKQDRLEDFYILAEAMFAKQYNFSWFLWRDLIAESKTPADRQRLEKIYQHFESMTTWYDFLPLSDG